MAGGAAGGALAGILIARNIANTKQGIDAAKESWKALEPRGFKLTLEEASALQLPTGKERPALAGKVGERPVTVHVKTDIVHFACTEIVATRATPWDGRVSVHQNPGGILGYLRTHLGQDIVIGDEAFDDAYLITGKPESAPQSLLAPSVRHLIMVLGAKLAAFSAEAEVTRVVLFGVEGDAELIAAATELAAAGASWTP